MQGHSKAEAVSLNEVKEVPFFIRGLKYSWGNKVSKQRAAQ